MDKLAKMREAREAQARSARLTELERKVEDAAKAVWTMAEALKEIREDELWRETHGSWTSYCEDRWGIRTEWARQTIAALDVRAQLADPKAPWGGPAHVSQASELAKVSEGDRSRVWEDARRRAERDGNKEPSLKRHVRPAIRDYKKQQAPKPPQPTAYDRASAAAAEVRRTGEAFCTRVEMVMPHLDNLSEAEAQSVAYEIAKTVHGVMATLEEHGRIKDEVVQAITDAPRNRREILVS